MQQLASSLYYCLQWGQKCPQKKYILTSFHCFNGYYFLKLWISIRPHTQCVTLIGSVDPSWHILVIHFQKDSLLALRLFPGRCSNKQETLVEKCSYATRPAGQPRRVKREPNWCILGGLLRLKSAVCQSCRSDQSPIAMYKLLLKTCCPTYGESPPQRHFIQRQRQIIDGLQEDMLAAGCYNASDTFGHCWEVCWLARITVEAKSGARADPHREWCYQEPDPSMYSSAVVTNVRRGGWDALGRKPG